MNVKNSGKSVTKIYNSLDKYFGDLNWWPAETPFEVIVGTILTQNTAWSNVEKAIGNLKGKHALNPGRIVRMSTESLQCAIRPSGYYRIKADRLKMVARFILNECNGNLYNLRKQDTLKLREKLLALKGVGPETADSILVYAFDKPVFVVDAYTKRIFSRHNIIGENASYDDIQGLVYRNFPKDTKKLNQFHALLVELAKEFCRKNNALCDKCPLKGIEKDTRSLVRFFDGLGINSTI